MTRDPGLAAWLQVTLTPGITDLFGTAVAMIPLVKEKRVRGLAVTSLRRLDAIADVPTLKFQVYQISRGMSIIVPKGWGDSVPKEEFGHFHQVTTEFHF